MSAHQCNEMLSDEWLTPPEIVKDLGPFDLDPCAPINRPWDTAKNHYTVDDNGLLQTWKGFVWCNPPYGKYTSRWLERLAMHGNGIALIFARTETDMFFRWVWNQATSILFIQGRLYFHHITGERSKSNSGAPSILVAYGEKADLKINVSNIEGKYIKL